MVRKIKPHVIVNPDADSDLGSDDFDLELDSQDDEDDDAGGTLLEPGDRLSMSADQILDVSGPFNAQRGRALFQLGAVNLRSFDGRAIHAQVSDDAFVATVSFGFDDLAYRCSCPLKRRGRQYACEHLAALQYAWIHETQSFELTNLGAALELYSEKPGLIANSGLDQPVLRRLAAAWQSAPLKVRESALQVPLNAAREQAAQLEAQLNAFGEQERGHELASMLHRFTLDQLRAIAERRRWTLRSTHKSKAIAELSEQLRASPQPESFSPEEEQLVRIENTLWGLAHTPSHRNLLSDWQSHGGNVAQLEHALQGLQSSGVLFPCTGENMGLHYHWSPFLTSATLPRLQPNVAPAPTKGTHVPAAGTAPLPLLAVLDAVLTFAEREPLHLRPRPADPKLVSISWIGQWPHDPAEVMSLTGARGVRRQAPATLTVPYEPFFADDTLVVLEALAGGVREYGTWVAATLANIGVIQVTPSDQAVVHAERASTWRALAPDQQYQTLWKMWCDGASLFADFRMALQDKSLSVRRSPVDPSFTPQALAADVGLARQFVARVLGSLAPQTWYDWPAFAGYVRKLRSGFLYTFTNRGQWWIEHAPTARRYDAWFPQQWDAAYLPVLQTMLTGALSWLGAVEHANSAFRITPLGAWLFTEGRQGHEPVVAAAVVEEGESLVWLDETTFRARPTPAAMRALASLRAYAEPLREMLTLRVSSAAIAHALAQGTEPQSIVGAFAGAGLPLAVPLHERIAALAASAGRLNLYERVTVLELGDDIALRELLATTALRAHIVHQFSPRLVVVRDEAVDALVAELVKKGHTPLVK
jgi:hypothetical protein